MIDLKIENRKGKIHVKSSEIKDILELRQTSNMYKIYQIL